MPRIILPDGLSLNIEITGAGSTLVLLHGFTGSTANWKDCTKSFAGQFKVIVIDLLGHGLSDSPADPHRYRMECCVEDVRSVFEQLGLRDATLLGYSMGGRVALSFALQHPEYLRALILESASPGLAEPAERQARIASDEALADSLERDGLEKFVNYWETIPLFASQARLPESSRIALREQRLRNNVLGLANSLRGLGTGVQSENWSRLASLSLPTLILAGNLDSKFTAVARQMAQTIPSTHLAIVPEAGHTIHLERPKEYIQRVLGFISSPG